MVMVRSEWLISIVAVRKTRLALVLGVLVAVGVATAATSERADPSAKEEPTVPAQDEVDSGGLTSASMEGSRPIDTNGIGGGEAAAAPSNDSCSNPAEIGVPTSIAGTTSGATVDTVPVCDVTATAPGVWYTVVGTGGTITATTCSDATHFNTKLSVFCGDCGSLNCVAGNDDSSTGLASCDLKGLPVKSTVGWCSSPGVVYRILVHADQSQLGDFVLTVYDDWTLCAGASACPLAAIGACCDNYYGGCYQSDDNNCLANRHVFQGLGTSCYSGTCTGACCIESTGSCESYAEGYCIAQAGTFHGGGSRCQDVSCFGACCDERGGCTHTGRNDCSSGGFQGIGTTCNDLAITCPGSGACCFENGDCRDASRARCELDGGTFHGQGTTCDWLTCHGACCIWGWCSEWGEAECRGNGGIFHGKGVSCGGVACTGACCNDIGGCSQTGISDCRGGFQGFGTSCDDASATCPGPWGACCDANGNCRQGSPAGCEGGGGVYQGNGAQCYYLTCRGACCLADESCYELGPGDCNDGWGGTFQGVGIPCYTVTCPSFPSGACCFDSGCQSRTPESCEAEGGTFQGLKTTCESLNNCVGACCLPWAQCSEFTSGECAQYGGDFRGVGSSCETASCPFGACCLDWGCETRAARGCADYGGNFRGVGSSCETEVCFGACCAFSSSACIDDVGSVGCARDFDGAYQGDGSTCTDAHECQNTLGACCDVIGIGGAAAQEATARLQPRVVAGASSGSCDDGVTAFECAMNVGNFREGMDCASAGCPDAHCPGVGECCVPHRSLGCNDASCCQAVCSVDPYCCTFFPPLGWDALCVELANRLCGDGTGGYCASALVDLNGDGIVDLLDYRLFQNSFGE